MEIDVKPGNAIPIGITQLDTVTQSGRTLGEERVRGRALWGDGAHSLRGPAVRETRGGRRGRRGGGYRGLGAGLGHGVVFSG